MLVLRPAVILVLVGATAALCGCSPAVAANCLAVRDPAATDCVTISGENWRFVEGEPEPDYADYCAAACVDFDADLAIADRNDLRTVPLLRKMRFIKSLRINVDTLSDVSGLELVEAGMIELWALSSTTNFTSFRGLSETSTADLRVKDALGVTSLDSLPPRGLPSLSLSRTNLVDVDVTPFTELSSLRLELNDGLQSVRLGSGRMDVVSLSSNWNVSRLEWGSGLVVEGATFFENSKLSSCLIQDFIADVKADGGYVMHNGPCP